MEIFACRIRNPGLGIPKTAVGIRNPTNLIGIRNPRSTEKDLESSTRNLESMIWNPESKIVLDSLTLGELLIVSKTHLMQQKTSKTLLGDMSFAVAAPFLFKAPPRKNRRKVTLILLSHLPVLALVKIDLSEIVLISILLQERE